MQIDLAGVALRLLPQRAAFLPDAGALLVADAHLGKAQSFRRLGVPVPSGTTAETLARLDAALAATGASEVVFLGDLLHSAHGRTRAVEACVARWRALHPALRLTLVRGNHDRHAGDPPPDWGVACVDEPLRRGPLALVHHPRAVPGAYALAGHAHPSIVVGGRAHDRLRIACFHFGAEVGVLPAFGAFTGTHSVSRLAGDRVYLVHDDAVRHWPGAATALPSVGG